MVTTTEDGVVYPADGEMGNFVTEAGERLQPGWQVNVGFANYTTLFTDATHSRAVPARSRCGRSSSRSPRRS